MAEGTNDEQGASQGGELDDRLKAFKQELLGEMAELLKTKGNDEAGGEGAKPDEKGGGSEQDDEPPGWFRRLLRRGKKDEAGGEEQGKPGAEQKPGEQGAESQSGSEQKPGEPEPDEAPPWATALAQKLDALEQQQGHGVDAKRSEVLDGLHVMQKARPLVPKFNPYTEEGRAEAEKWAADNQEFLTVRRVEPIKPDMSAIPEDGFVSADREEVAQEMARLGELGRSIQSRWGR
jgi:hypothetical protein